MINYIQSELFRARNSRLIKFIFLAGILVPALFLVIIDQELVIEVQNLYNGKLQNQYIAMFITMMVPASYLLGHLLLIFIKKNDDIYRLVLNQGLTKNYLVLYDILAYTAITITIGLIYYIIALIYGNLLGYLSYESILRGNEIFTRYFLGILLAQLLSNMVLYSLYMILRSPGLAIIANIILMAIGSNTFSFTVSNNQSNVSLLLETNRSILVKIASYLSPHYILGTYFEDLYLQNALSQLDIVKVLAYTISICIICIPISQAAFRRREL